MNSQKPLIRTLHHLSCSGGSVLSKCIASMRNTIVISEVHPDQLRYEFNPYDPIQLLLSQTNLGKDLQLRRQIFLKRIIDTEQILRNNKMNTVLRDHTHFDYLIQNNLESINSKASLIETIRDYFDILSVLSIRNPIDSYLSLVNNNWNDSVSSFDDYCSRVLLMLETYESFGTLIIKYEDFCSHPDKTLKQICEKLKLNFSKDYEEKFFEIPMTGDSGRASELKKIEQPFPRKIDTSLHDEIIESKSFKVISKKYSYKSR